MTPDLVIAVDPGGTTGLSFWSPPGLLTVPDLSSEPRQREFWPQMVEDITGWCRHIPHVVIVCETFKITNATVKLSQQTDALEIIGALKFVAHLYNPGPVVMQTPADAKRFSSDARLKAAGFWRPGEGHANDASRHLLLWLAKNRLIDILEVDRGIG